MKYAFKSEFELSLGSEELAKECNKSFEMACEGTCPLYALSSAVCPFYPHEKCGNITAEDWKQILVKEE